MEIETASCGLYFSSADSQSSSKFDSVTKKLISLDTSLTIVSPYLLSMSYPSKMGKTRIPKVKELRTHMLLNVTSSQRNHIPLP